VIRTAFLGAALLLAACQHGATTAGEAIVASNHYMARVWPQMRLDHLRVEARDRGGRWRVAYIAPEGSTGSDIVIYVDKQTGQASEPPIDPNANVFGPVPPPP
jgi:hypothetical protein